MKTLKIVFEPMELFFQRAEKALGDSLSKRKKFIQKKDIRIWSSVEAYQQFMSDQKYAILAAIAQYQPHSVYQLAKILGRAQQNVARDCELLAEHEFIRLIENSMGRKTKAPRLFFDYSGIEIQLPQVSYTVEFKRTAA